MDSSMVTFAKVKLSDGQWKVTCTSQYLIAYPQLPAHPKPTVYENNWRQWYVGIHRDPATAYEEAAENALRNPHQVISLQDQ